MPYRPGLSNASTLLASVGLAASILGPAAAETVRPGYWESTNKVTSPIESLKIERRCVTPRDVAKFMTCHINHHYTCDCPEQSYSAGQIHFRGDCIDAKGRHVHIQGDGSYTATTLQMTARGNFKLMGLPIDFSASTSSHRIADVCPPGSPGSGTPTR